METTIVVKKKWTFIREGNRIQNLKPESVADLLKDVPSTEVVKVITDREDRAGLYTQVMELAIAINRQVTETEGSWELVVQKEKGVRAPKLPYIILGQNLVFTNAQDALSAVNTIIKDELPVKHRFNKAVSQTTLKGTMEGQVFAMFKLLKTYGIEKIASYLREWVNLTEPMQSFKWAVTLYNQGVDPTEVLTEEGRVDHTYFKYWVIRKDVEAQ